MKSTHTAIQPDPTIPKGKWDEFCSEYPLSGKAIDITVNSQNIFLASILTTLLEQSIIWCEFKKLKKINIRFEELSKSTKDIPDFACRYFSRVHA